jgi:integrase
MARRVKDKALDSREARSALKSRGKPYWRAIEKGLHLGYRRLKGKTGTWVARHYVGNQAYQIESLGPADDLSDADGVAILSFWQAQNKARDHMVRRVHAANGISGPLTVKVAVESYLAALDAEARDTRDARYRAKAHIYPALGDVEVASLTAEALTAWQAAISRIRPRMRTPRGEPQRFHEFDTTDVEACRKRRATANRITTVLRAALNRAFREGRVPSDVPWRRVRRFRQVDAARIRFLSVDEAKRLINASAPDFRLLVIAALQTGARYSELAKLQVQDVNIDAGTLAIRQSKSGRPRHAVLTDEGRRFFAELIAGRNGGEMLLLRANGSAWVRAYQQKPMAEAVARARISPSAGFHALRHTYASHCVMNGVPLLVVAKNLGHADTKMVERHYGHLAPSYVADAIRAGAPTFGIATDSKIAPLGTRR